MENKERSNNDFRTVSTKIRRIPTFLDFNDICERENKTHSSKIKELIEKEIKKKNDPYFYAGNIRVVYNKVLNNFSLKAYIKNGEEVTIWKNLSEDFVKSLRGEIDSAIQTRNKFVHNLGNEDDNIAIPRETLEGEDE